jgi:hypothetical protein
MSFKVRRALIALMMAMSTVPANHEAATAGSGSGTCSRVDNQVTCTLQWGASSGGLPQIIYVPDRDKRDTEEAVHRDKRWLARCNPVIRQDRYGVERYSYSASGCEFGKSED